MATLALQTIQDGPKWHIVKATVTGTDTTNLDAATLVDASAVGADELSIYSIQSSFTGFDADVYWDASSNVLAAHLPEGENGQCFKDIGGLVNNAATGKTGDILLSTTGIATDNTGHLIVKCRKHNTNSL
jgi:hypothetical protein